MLKFNIEDYEEELWDKALKEAEKELAKAKELYDRDPQMIIFDCHVELQKLLEQYEGKQRLTTEFKNKVSSLAKKEKKARELLAQGLDIVKCGDLYYEALHKRDAILQKSQNLKFYRRR